MSIDIDWQTLTTGTAGKELADSIRDFIHDKFQQVQLPRFIRSVHVHSFDFGKECPVVELKDISDPLPEFYEDEVNSIEDQEEVDEDHAGGVSGASTSDGPTSIRPATNGASKVAKPSYIDTHLPNLRSGFNFYQEQNPTPFLSQSSTPGIPGGTSNFSYFHLPLSAGLSGTQTPLAAVTPFSPAWQEQHQNHLSSGLKGRQHHPPPPFADPNSRPSTAGASQIPPTFSPPTAQSQPQSSDRTLDLQTTLHISYSGSLSLSLTAEILLDYPMPSFVGIPLKLHITGLSFDGLGLLAYLRQPGGGEIEEGRNKVHFCFLGGEDAEAMMDGGNRVDEGVIGGGKDGVGGLLREIRVESEIGRQEGGKQVLKNVGKVERFVLEQVRKIFEDEFVWPSFWTFLV